MSDAEPTVLFIGGAGRSGSTLLECALDQVSGIVAAGEVTHLWERGMAEDQLCGCGRTFSLCPFWTEVLRAAFSGGLPGSADVMVRLKREALSPLWWIAGRGARQRYTDVLARLYRGIAEVSGAGVVVDSSKYPPEAYLLRAMHGRGINVRYVHLVRESNAVVHSWQREKLRPEIHDRVEHMPRYPWWKTAVAWEVFNTLFDVLSVLEPGAVMRLRYEDFVADPASALEAMCRHVGLSRPGLDFVQGSSVALAGNHTVSGNPSRFRTGTVELQVDGGWREEVPRWQERAVSFLTLPHTYGYGYERKRPS